MKKKSTPLDWLQREIKKDHYELEKGKMDLINEIKKHKKESLVIEKEISQLSLWKRIKKVLMG